MINVSSISHITAEFNSSQICYGADVPDITQLFHSPTSNPGHQLQFSSGIGERLSSKGTDTHVLRGGHFGISRTREVGAGYTRGKPLNYGNSRSRLSRVNL
jgi:hypothetical protein